MWSYALRRNMKICYIRKKLKGLKMTNEEMQSTIEFLIKYQSQFSTDIQQLVLTFNKLIEIQAKSEDKLSKIEESITLMTQMVQQSDQRLDMVTNNLSIITNNIATLSQRAEELVNAQIKTEQVVTNIAKHMDDLTININKYIKSTNE
jgi:hypothetical protein